MPEESKIKKAESDFQNSLNAIRKTSDTSERRALLNIALRQNDYIYHLKKHDGRNP